MIIRKFFHLFLAIIAVLLGIFALLVPILPTSPFIVFALALAAPKKSKRIISLLKRFRDWMRKKIFRAP